MAWELDGAFADVPPVAGVVCRSLVNPRLLPLSMPSVAWITSKRNGPVCRSSTRADEDVSEELVYGSSICVFMSAGDGTTSCPAMSVAGLEAEDALTVFESADA